MVKTFVISVASFLQITKPVIRSIRILVMDIELISSDYFSCSQPPHYARSEGVTTARLSAWIFTFNEKPNSAVINIQVASTQINPGRKS
jgi:hypothetical protein